MIFPAFLLSVMGLVSAGAENWSGWRGPQGNGSLAAGETPTQFSAEKNLKWKVALPGRGCSSPVVWGDRIFVTTPVGEEDGVVAYDGEGKEVWSKTFGALEPGRGQRIGSSANSSPLTDGERVYVYFKSGNLAALTMAGELLWKINLFGKYGENKLWWDNGTSPVLAGGNLILAMMQTDAPSYLVALNPKTGEKVWKVDREFEVGIESGDSYTTPHVIKDGEREVLVCFGADHLTGHDAKTGEQLWFCGGINPKKEKAWRVIASSVLTKDVAVVPIARGAEVGGIRVGGKGDLTKTNWLWRKKMSGTDAATPVARDGKVYLLSDRGKTRGTVTCLEAETGKVLWEETLPKSAQTYYASPVLVGNKFYCPREDGVVFCATLGPKGFEAVSANAIGEGVIASPAVLGKSLLIRGDSHLFCFEEGE